MPYRSLGADVEATQRELDMLDAPTLLVGHSYGGVVISEVGVDSRVAGLGYVAALAPEAFEDVVDLQKNYNLPSNVKSPRAYKGFLQFDQNDFIDTFATPGISDIKKAQVLAASQKPIGEYVFGQRIRVAAWRDKDKPRWYAVSAGDRSS